MADDGKGFRVGEVPAQRLGVARSIESRMRAIAGGEAVVHSTPGEGTRIELSWRHGTEALP